jgi:hypothetical protein
MKMIKYVIAELIGLVTLNACELERDYEAGNVKIVLDSYKIVSESIADGVINTGETVIMNFRLKNTGSDDAKSIKVTFTSPNVYLTSLSPTTAVDYGDIPAGTSKWFSDENAVSFVISLQIPIDDVTNPIIPLLLHIVDEKGRKWEETFELKIYGFVALSIDSYSVVYDNNKNGIVNSGETVYLNVNVRNDGNLTAHETQVSFETNSKYISGLYPNTKIRLGMNAQVRPNDIVDGSHNYFFDDTSKQRFYTIKLTVASDTPANTQIPITCNIVYCDLIHYFTATSSFMLNVQ